VILTEAFRLMELTALSTSCVIFPETPYIVMATSALLVNELARY
jgi:hypothetical protein